MERINEPAYHRVIALLDMRPRQALLEIGFGTGRLLEIVVRKRQQVLLAGIDPSELMLATAQARLAREIPRPDLRCGFAEALPWLEASFDAACAVHSFQFWSDPVRSASEIRRVLRPGGRLVLMLRVHSRWPPADLPNPISRSNREVEGAADFVALHRILRGRSQRGRRVKSCRCSQDMRRVRN
jgi:ubiquinone/menaquinone biosynthesis C-methylase UbiE